MWWGVPGQARDRYPIVLIRSGDVAETLHTMRPTPLRHGDVICIADECFLFESIVRPAPPQVTPAPLPAAQAYPLWPSVPVHPREGRGGQAPVGAAQVGAGAAEEPDAAGDRGQAGADGAAGASGGSGGAGSSGQGRASAGQASGAAAGDEGGQGAGGSCGGRMPVGAAASDGAPGSGAAAGVSSGAGAAEPAGASSGSALLGMAGSCLAVPRHAKHEC